MSILDENLDEKPHDALELKLPAKTDYISTVRLCASGIADRMKFSVDDIEDIKSAVSEVCINSIKHGYDNKSDPDNVIEVRFLIREEELIIIVKDFGKGFDTTLVDNYIEQEEKGKKRPEHIGTGVYIIKTLMDQVEYSSNPSGTQVQMVKKLNR